MTIGAITTKLWWGTSCPHDWQFKKSTCQIELSLYWWTDICLICIWSPFVVFLSLRHIWIHPKKYKGYKLIRMMNGDESWQYSSALSSCQYPGQSFAFRRQPLIFTIPVCNVDCRLLKSNVFLKRGIVMSLMSINLIQS